MAPLRFPWPSSLVALFTAAYLLAAAEPGLLDAYALPPDYFRQPYPLLALFLLAATVVFDIYRFHRQRQALDRRLQEQRRIMEELLEGKNKLQRKARTYSDHADKLKLYISERLLEHIEYDEKFLHFRNIAGEVRHNGAICHDKVTSALRHALEGTDGPERERYRDALDGMDYLWVLLDLSTTDNIAMYIANGLYECEERYFQQQLAGDAAETPGSPTYDPRAAVIRALRGFLDPDEHDLPPAAETEGVWRHRDARFHIELGPVGELLGEPNHLVLLTENLINNALYHSGKRRGRNPHARVAVRLDEVDGRIRLRVYNRGPAIAEEDRAKIFRLGYSTRRSPEGDGGRGLGLYFVNEIARGHEGEVRVEAVRNREDTYVIRIALADGDTRTEIVQVAPDGKGRPRCRTAQRDGDQASATYRLPGPVSDIEITAQTRQATWTFTPPEDDAEASFLDPGEAAHPRWSLQLARRKTGHRLTFRPLDIGGMQFSVLLPTAHTRLDPDFHELAEDALANETALDRHREAIEPFVR